uniref:F-box domain-containing protein n=1 Tax=Mycena chlorophos TaxID=658473 RepID=A0ABQ0LKW1_MYCCL|nr:predicted protein [Mycena chlorophos]
MADLSALPDELLAEIFIRYLPPYPEHPPLMGPGSPTYLLGICTLWRTVALHTPVLWRAIRIGEVCIDERWVTLLEDWLARSGTCDLSLRLAEFLEESDLRWVQTLLERVLAERHRWEYVFWNMFDPMWTGVISGDGTLAPPPRLQELTLITYVLPDAPPVNLNPASAPESVSPSRLRTVCLWNVGFTAASFVWADLTSLALVNVDFRQCLRVLGFAIQLVQCRLHLDYDSTSSAPPPPPPRIRVELPRMKAFCIYTRLAYSRNANGAPGEDLLAPFVLPALRKLEVSEQFLGLHPQEGCEWVLALLARSGLGPDGRRQLERLRVLRVEYIRPEDVRGAFAACRRVFSETQTVFDHVGDYIVMTGEGHWRAEGYWDLEGEDGRAGGSMKKFASSLIIE